MGEFIEAQKKMRVDEPGDTSVSVPSSNAAKPKGEVITAAVAGNEATRRLRACIANATCPNLVNKFATAGAVAFNPKMGLGVPLALEITGAKEKAILKTGEDPEKIDSVDKFRPTSEDTVLIIGQVCGANINKDCEPLLGEIKDCTVYSQGGTNASDFNISSTGTAMLSNNGCKYTPVGRAECPVFDFVNKWRPLISKYADVAKDVHYVGVGGFLTSRTATKDGAFYRQFGLEAMANDAVGAGNGKVIMDFESGLAKKVRESTDFSEAEGITDKMGAIISYCDKNANPDYGRGELPGGKEDVYVKLYSMWNSALNAVEHPNLMTHLTHLILETLEEVGSPGANEYDGYTVAKMLYDHVAINNGTTSTLTPDLYYTDLMNLFERNVCSPIWKKGLDIILSKGDLLVYHDAGLDPYVDDYIALKILSAAKKGGGVDIPGFAAPIKKRKRGDALLGGYKQTRKSSKKRRGGKRRTRRHKKKSKKNKKKIHHKRRTYKRR